MTVRGPSSSPTFSAEPRKQCGTDVAASESVGREGSYVEKFDQSLPERQWDPQITSASPGGTRCLLSGLGEMETPDGQQAQAEEEGGVLGTGGRREHWHPKRQDLQPSSLLGFHKCGHQA